MLNKCFTLFFILCSVTVYSIDSDIHKQMIKEIHYYLNNPLPIKDDVRPQFEKIAADHHSNAIKHFEMARQEVLSIPDQEDAEIGKQLFEGVDLAFQKGKNKFLVIDALISNFEAQRFDKYDNWNELLENLTTAQRHFEMFEMHISSLAK